MSEFVTIAEAADYLSMSESLVRRMIGDGRLIGYVDLDEIDAWMQPIRR